MNLIYALLIIVVLSTLNLQPLVRYHDGIESFKQNRFYLSIGIIIVLVILILFNRKFITKPLIEFENQIERIGIDGFENHQIELSSTKALGILSDKFNILLSKIAYQIKEIDNDRVELRSLNEELEATYGQLVATEQEASRQKRNFEALFRNSTNAIVMFDQEHRVLDINESFTELFGYTLEEVKGIHIDTVVLAEDHKSEIALITKTVFDSSVDNHSSFEAIRYGKDGLPLHVSIQIIPMRDGHLTMSGYVIYIEAPSLQDKAIYTIIKRLHENNKWEEQHSKRVSELSYCFGKALNLTEREISELKTIGLLHDVGKIAIDENLLNKEGKLTVEEYEEIKKHPAIGYRILSTVNEMCEIADYILAHHESYDGSGYPKGLKGEEIPYLSRIITVIDAFDAMTSDRPYRRAMTYQEAYSELRRVSGSQFDSNIVKSFIAFMERESELQKNKVLGWISNSMCLKIKGDLDHEKY
jgi:PAS domain S-box-containing protein